MPVEEVLPPRWVPGPTGSSGRRFSPWVEVSLRARIRIVAWEHEDACWMHWVFPVRDGGVDLHGARPFDPGAHAAVAGEPPENQVALSYRLEAGEAERVADAVRALVPSSLFRQSEVGVVSVPGESLEGFRRRCLRDVGGALRAHASGGPLAASSLARVAGGIEEHRLEPGEVETLTLRVRVTWYPEGVQPASSRPDLMVRGDATAGR